MKRERHDPDLKRAAPKRIVAARLRSLSDACRLPKTGTTFGRHALGAIALVATLSGCQSKSGASDVLDPSAIAAPAGQASAAAAPAQQASVETSGSPALDSPASGSAASGGTMRLTASEGADVAVPKPASKRSV